MGRSKGMIFFIMMTVTVLLSGCWSKKELTDLAIVSAMGVDKTEDGKYAMTLQIINPGNVAGGMHGSQSPPVSIYSATGDNLVEASRRASGKISRRLYYAHANLVVVGEKLAREEGVAKIIDAIDRDHEFRITTTMVIANSSTAEDLLRTLTPIDKIPANKILKALEFSQKKWGHSLKTSIQDVMKGLQSSDGATVVSGFRLVGDPKRASQLDNIQESEPESTLEASGIGILKKGKLVDWAYGQTARGTVWIKDEIQGTDINIDWKEHKEAIAYQTIRQKTTVSGQMKNGQPHISVHTRVEGSIGEMNVPLDITDVKIISKMEKKLEKKIKGEIKQAIEQAQANKADVFGFDEVIRRAARDDWQKLKPMWNDVYFPELKVDITVETYIRRAGLRNKSFLSSLDEE
ncbi:Ger(x)C family spore germination protein [Rossellomorea aquimaris]|uniref:Ger(x)C family spore germination protein n=1 Tax=Rossellomorea aquimaris TaxID=189382 RepID=UPI001CD79220|nr:Ger(x)C family spore germination protein [Rossellomorea aquimaris]MCA1060243.1 Ger(x)C family spore germination protein [Rossellomorea aquimaris]